MATRKPMKKFKRYEGGGEVMGEMDPMEAAAKKRGLEMSNKEAPVGFFERIRAGNIDQPGTEAYNRFGAGRGRAAAAEEERPMPVARPPCRGLPTAGFAVAVDGPVFPGVSSLASFRPHCYGSAAQPGRPACRRVVDESEEELHP